MASKPKKYLPRAKLIKRSATDDTPPTRAAEQPHPQLFNDGCLWDFLSSPHLTFDTLVSKGTTFDASSLAVVAALFCLCRDQSRPAITVLWVNGNGGNGFHMFNHLAFYLEGLLGMYAYKGRQKPPVSLWFKPSLKRFDAEQRRFIIKEVTTASLMVGNRVAFDPDSTLVLIDPFKAKHSAVGVKDDAFSLLGLDYLLDNARHIYCVTPRCNIRLIRESPISRNEEVLSTLLDVTNHPQPPSEEATL